MTAKNLDLLRRKINQEDLISVSVVVVHNQESFVRINH